MCLSSKFDENSYTMQRTTTHRQNLNKGCESFPSLRVILFFILENCTQLGVLRDFLFFCWLYIDKLIKIIVNTYLFIINSIQILRKDTNYNCEILILSFCLNSLPVLNLMFNRRFSCFFFNIAIICKCLWGGISRNNL